MESIKPVKVGDGVCCMKCFGVGHLWTKPSYYVSEGSYLCPVCRGARSVPVREKEVDLR